MPFIRLKSPKIATDNNNLYLVYEKDYGTSSEILLSIVDPKTLNLKKTVQVSSKTGFNYSPSIGKASNGIAISWISKQNNNADVKLRILDNSGNPITNEIFVNENKDGTQDEFSLAISNNGIHIAYTSDTEQAGNTPDGKDIFQRSFDFNGNPLSQSQLLVTKPNDQGKPHLKIQGTDAILTYIDFTDNTAWIKTPTIESQITLPSACIKATSELDANQDIILACEVLEKDINIYIKKLDQTGNLSDITALAEKGDQFQHVMKKIGNSIVLVYTNKLGADSDIYMMRIDENGNPSQPERIDKGSTTNPLYNHGLEVAGVFSTINNAEGIAGSKAMLSLAETDGSLEDITKKAIQLIEDGNKIIAIPLALLNTNIPPEYKKGYNEIFRNLGILAAEYNAIIILPAENEAINEEIKNLSNICLVRGHQQNQKTLLKQAEIYAPGWAFVPTGVDENGNPMYGYRHGNSIAVGNLSLVLAYLHKAINWNPTVRQYQKFLIIGGKKQGKCISVSGAVECAQEKPSWTDLETIIQTDGDIIRDTKCIKVNNTEYIIMSTFPNGKIHVIKENPAAVFQFQNFSHALEATISDTENIELYSLEPDPQLSDGFRLRKILFNTKTETFSDEGIVIPSGTITIGGKTYNNFTLAEIGGISIDKDTLVCVGRYGDDPFNPDQTYAIFIFKRNNNQWIPVSEIKPKVEHHCPYDSVQVKVDTLGRTHIVFKDHLNSIALTYLLIEKDGTLKTEDVLFKAYTDSNGYNHSYVRFYLWLYNNICPVIHYAELIYPKSATSYDVKFHQVKREEGKWQDKVIHQYNSGSNPPDRVFYGVDVDGRAFWADSLGNLFADCGYEITSKTLPQGITPRAVRLRKEKDYDNIREFILTEINSGIITLYRCKKPDY